MPARGPQPGDVIDERFRLELMIGTGGMGAVWSAAVVGAPLDIGGQNAEKVAIKFLHSAMASDPLLVQRFLLEARAGTEIQHPNVVRVIAQGFLEPSDASADPAPWLAMELLDGKPLGDALRLRGRVEAVDALAILADVTAGIAAAHVRGIVHRDIKPGNVFLQQTPEGIVAKVLDFGISKYVDPSMDGGLTSTGAIVGSALYMSPEQAAGGYNVDPRTDVWSLGIMLYRMLTGEHPLPSTGQQDVMMALATPKELDLASLRHPRIPATAAEIVRRCLRKKREERIPSAVELEPELRAALKAEIAASRAPDIDYLLRPASSRATVIAAPVDGEREQVTSATAPTGYVVDAGNTVAPPTTVPPVGPPTPRRGTTADLFAPSSQPMSVGRARPANGSGWGAKAGAVAFGIALVALGGAVYRLRAHPPDPSPPVAAAPLPPATVAPPATPTAAEEEPIEELEAEPVTSSAGTAHKPVRAVRPRPTPRPKASSAPSAAADPWRRPGF